jgi:hypothetical protein
METIVSVGKIVVILSLIVGVGHSQYPTLFASANQSECKIKGNISYNRGRKIYHLPGMKDYEVTKIDLKKGERWFCTESEAITNGWIKASR